jgi:hypothetical protein
MDCCYKRQPAALLPVLALCTACGGRSIERVESADSACVYGNIVVDDGYVPNNVIMHEVGVVYAPPFASPPTAVTFDNGDFFFDNVKAGRYYLARFMVGNDMFAFAASSEEELEPMVFEVKPGEAHYYGSFRATSGRGSVFSPAFDFQRATHPDESEIARTLMPHLSGTGWDARVQAALRTQP